MQVLYLFKTLSVLNNGPVFFFKSLVCGNLLDFVIVLIGAIRNEEMTDISTEKLGLGDPVL